MTPERAAYHYLMLSVGCPEEFYREFDEALDTENPLRDLTVQLCAAPPSDAYACRSVLMNYYVDHRVEGSAVYAMVYAELRRRWQQGSPDWELANLAWSIQQAAEDRWETDWEDLRDLTYALDYLEDGMITPERHRWCLEQFFTTGTFPNPLPPAPEKKTWFRRLWEVLTTYKSPLHMQWAFGTPEGI